MTIHRFPSVLLTPAPLVTVGHCPAIWQLHLTVDYLHPKPVGLLVLADAIPLDVLRLG